MLDTYRRNEQWRAKTSLKNIPLLYFKGLCVRGVGDRTELQYNDPHSYCRQRCVFLVRQAAQPEAQGPSSLLDDGFLYYILSPPGLQNSIGGPRAPSAGCGFPYHILSPTSLNPNCLTSCLDRVYNSSTPTQSPTQSLEWHVLSSSSRNNCPAVQRSFSSGASVYECIIGFYLVPFHQPNPPMQSLSVTGHWNVSLPSAHHIGMACLAGSKVNIKHYMRKR